MTNDSYKGLDNKEILVIYYKMSSFLNELNLNLDKQRVQKVVDTPMGKGVAYISISEDKVQQFKDAEQYKSLVSLVDKLKPIAELIEDCDDSCKLFANQLQKQK
jgi:hypothetical protein